VRAEIRSPWDVPSRGAAEIDYKIDADRMLKIVPEDRGFTAKIREIPSKTEIAAVVGRVDDSLFNAVEDAGESAELAMRMAQIFGYDLDFYTDPRKGDTFRIVLEKKKYANGQTAGYGKILARNTKMPGKSIKRCSFTIRRPARILFGRRQVAAESVSSIAAEIRCAGDVAFQQGAFPSDSQNLPATYGDGLWRASGDAGADDWERPGGIRGAEGRGRQSGASGAFEWLRNDVSAFVADVRAPGRAH